MNCPKCNSPINDGDKFCQVCGNVLNNTTPQQPAVETPNPAAQAPVVNEQPVVNNAQQPMNQGMNYNQAPMPNAMPQQPMNQGMNYNQAPMPNAMPQQPMNNVPVNNQMSGIPQEPKKNNTIVMILAGIIVILLAFVVYLVVASGNSEEPEKEVDSEKDEPAKEEVITAKYTEATVNGYKFKLPEKYHAELYEGQVLLYNDDMDFEATVESIDGNYDSLNKEGTKINLTTNGMTGVTYEEKTINGKKMVVFTGEYMGYKIEYVYIKYSLSKILGSAIVYENNYDSVHEEIYDILAQVEIDDSSFSSNANTKLPQVSLKDALGQQQ